MISFSSVSILCKIVMYSITETINCIKGPNYSMIIMRRHIWWIWKKEYKEFLRIYFISIEIWIKFYWRSFLLLFCKKAWSRVIEIFCFKFEVTEKLPSNVRKSFAKRIFVKFYASFLYGPEQTSWNWATQNRGKQKFGGTHILCWNYYPLGMGFQFAKYDDSAKVRPFDLFYERIILSEVEVIVSNFVQLLMTALQ